MDQKRLLIAIAISIAILLGFQFLLPHPQRVAAVDPAGQGVAPTQSAMAPKPSNTLGAAPSDAGAAPVAPPANSPRLKIEAPRLDGSISLLGGRIDNVVLRDYRETIQADSPHVRLLEARSDPQPTYAQFGWTASATCSVPDPNTTLWTASGDELVARQAASPCPGTTGPASVFEIQLPIDDNYMFTVRQQRPQHRNAPQSKCLPGRASGATTRPWSPGYYILHEGLLGVLDGRLKESSTQTPRPRARRTTASPSRRPVPTAGPASPTSIG